MSKKHPPYPLEFRQQMIELVRADGLTAAEREELNRLRREVKQLKLERQILSKAAAQLSLGRWT